MKKIATKNHGYNLGLGAHSDYNITEIENFPF